MIMVLSQDVSRSKWVSFEGTMFYGQANPKPIIPVVLDDEGKSLANELGFLKDRFYVDFSKPQDREESVAKLSSALSDLRSG